MLLDAVAKVTPEIPILLRIVGDGPMAGAWREQAARLGLAERVSFTGNLPPAAVAAELRAAHVMCLPSVRESGGAVLLEAMACARPVIAIGFGGPAEIVDDAVGRCLPATSSGEVVAALAEALRDLVRHPADWKRRGEVGRARAESRYDWDAKVDAAVTLYRDLLADPVAARARWQSGPVQADPADDPRGRG
jgi:glycosyltransferase involved in cell wall biosynthesis